MSVEQARAIVEREGAALRCFVNYLDDPGIQLHFRVMMMAVANRPKEAGLFYELYQEEVRQLVVLGLPAAAPALAMIVAAVSELVDDPDHDEVIFPSALIPSQETVEAYLTLFHEDMGYTRDSEGPQDAPADGPPTPWAYEQS